VIVFFARVRRVSVTPIPFVVRGRQGMATVTYVANEDPTRWGYPVLGLGLTEAAVGFPVTMAAVSAFAGDGWEAVMSWLQLVWISGRDDGEADELIFDRAPQLLEPDVPYFSWGPTPSLFDAPSIKGPSHVDWTAHTMLAYSPDGVMTKVVRPVCGFEWGYRLRQGRPQVSQLRVTAPVEWAADCEAYAHEFPAWRFELDSDA
jgi:hypothetical protein